jgi:hypothetical protein
MRPPEPVKFDELAPRRTTPLHQWRRSKLEFAAAALPVLVVLSLYVWRPLKLGFYSDDWLTFLHPEPGTLRALSDLLSLYQNRPVSGLLAWLAQLATDWDPARAQAVNVALLVISAIPLGWLTYTLGRSLTGRHDARLWGASVAATAYLVFPWTLGFSAWVTAAISAAPATFLFCLAACLLVGPNRDRLSTQVLATLLMGGSFLTYESFYGQFIFVLILAAVTTPVRKLNWVALRPALLLSIMNVACFAYNRLASGNRKSFSDSWYQTFLYGYFHTVWPNFLRSVRGVGPIVVACLIVVLSSGLVLLARTIGPWRTVLAVLAILSGIYAAGVLYAMAGYGLITVGIFARVTVILSCYGALLLGLLGTASAARLDNERWLARSQIVASVALLTAFGIASSYRLVAWAQSWDVQQEILLQFPHDAKALASPDVGFLYVGPLGPADVPIASAPWEIPGTIAYAIFKGSPSDARRLMADVWSGAGGRWLADSPNWSTSFDGATLSQHLCGNPAVTFSIAAKELWVWRVGKPQLEQAPKGLHVGCDDPSAPN